MSHADYKPIDDYAIIGDCRSAALIARDGSIDWLCWPRFDSPSIFAALLDSQKGGNWRLSPLEVEHSSRAYIEGTNVLISRFKTSTGECEFTDCMSISRSRHESTPGLPDHEILRRIRCLSGHVQIRSSVAFRPGYAQADVNLRHRPTLGVELDLGRAEAWFRSSHEITVHEELIEGRFTLQQGETAWFSLSYSADSPAIVPALAESAQKRLDDTIHRWKHWSSQLTYDGPWRDVVLRSALTLKLMTYAPSGAIIAAPTTSLPERIGGSLNWDYRYCWLRDASLTIRALNGLGFRAEVDAFIGWMLSSTSLSLPELNVLYDVFGGTPRAEYEAKQLSGYRDSRPVRINNAATGQLQLDVYGEVLDAVSQFIYTGGSLDRSAQRAVRRMVDYVVKNWNCPDDGIWEPRGERRNHTHSRLLCWVAIDRFIGISERGAIAGVDCSKYEKIRDQIRDQIQAEAWNPEFESFTSTYQGDRMDASLLLMSWYGFEHADSPKMQATYRRMLKDLRVGNGLIHRYVTHPPEGAFGICCFWEAEFLALGGGSLEQASNLFETLIAYSNDLGLFAEEIDPASGNALGNYPQAFTHVGLISAAISIDQRMRGEKQLEHREPTAA